MTDEYLKTADLRKRGWTEALIRTFLGEPDKLARNPRYATAAPTKLWSIGRVTTAEAAPGFGAALKAAAARGAAARQVADAKRQQLLEIIAARPVRVPMYEPDELRRRAINHYNGRLRDPDEQPATVGSDRAFLERIEVNFLRHRCTGYERSLAAVAGKIGVRDAEDAIRRKVYAAIGEAYPALRDECDRQLAWRLVGSQG
jgi:hypothetical protein